MNRRRAAFWLHVVLPAWVGLVLLVPCVAQHYSAEHDKPPVVDLVIVNP